MILITIQDIVTQDGRRVSDHPEHILTDMELCQFIGFYGDELRAKGEQYPGMGGGFSILNVVDVGDPPAATIRDMQSQYFAGSVRLLDGRVLALGDYGKDDRPTA